MRQILRFVPAVLVLALLWVMSHPLGALPAIGTVIDPVNGLMAAAEPVDEDFNADLKLRGVQEPVEVWFEDRLVPHIRAQNDHDLYFTQGYVHAYFRLWQMDMQTRAAGGRVAEVAGEKAVEFDRGQRRKGMVFGAEKSLTAMEADPRTRDMLNAYRDGINTYIATLNFRELPIEYKLMGFRPEAWTNLRSALLLKYMADDLTGKTDDIAFTLLRDQLGEEEFDYLFPERIQGSKPVIPEGTKFDAPSLKTPPVPEGDIWAHFGSAPVAGKAPSQPPPKGEEVLGKHLAYAFPQAAGTFPTCHLPPPAEGRDGGLMPKFAPAANVRDATVNVCNGEKQIGDAVANIADGKNNIADGSANVRGGAANVGDAEKYVADGSAKVRGGVANVGDGAANVGDVEKYNRDGSANVRGGSADFMAGADRDRCHPELVKGRHLSRAAPPKLFISWFDGAHHEMKRGAATVDSSQFAVYRPATIVEAIGATCYEPCSNNPPTTLQPSSNGSEDPDVAVGSNNWAISGQHTASGKPILCNDPHLGLNLPSLWFEIQLSAPGISTYGVSLPGAPGVVIGYNEKISWGFTNNYRDVKDFYLVRPIDASNTAYYFGNGQQPFERKIERIGIKGGSEKFDTVLYTIHGPVMHDPSFPDPAKTGKLLACTWMAHRGTNELLSLYLVNRAADYESFTQAIQHFECPAQNFVYADVTGNIAMWGQGRFINKWKGQGKFVMNGADSSTLWGDTIPMGENPHVLNPPQGYLASANQQVTDSTYPYWYNGNFTEWRSWEINRYFDAKAFLALANLVVGVRCNACYQPDMREMQNDNHSLLAGRIIPVIQSLGEYSFKLDETKNYWKTDTVLNLQPTTTQPLIFQLWWHFIQEGIWKKRFAKLGTRWPGSEVTAELLTNHPYSKYFDDPNTSKKESRDEVVRVAYAKTIDSLKLISEGLKPQWYQVKNTSLTHLAKISAFSYDHLKIGGWGNTINAVSGNHGPSWRMIVEMDSIPKACAIYPGGQSGNPGSKHYGDNVQQWVDGKYNELIFLTDAVTKNPFRYTWKITS